MKEAGGSSSETKVYQLYNGFSLTEPVGNNAFSYDKRINKNIYVPALRDGHPKDVRMGDKIVFSEVEDGVEQNQIGLQYFLRWKASGKEILIFDNHNHAFFFWHWGHQIGRLPGECRLLHIDQHKDTREPDLLPPFSLKKPYDLNQVWNYTNFVLNVGNFIPPAIHTGLIKEVVFVDGQADFEAPLPDFDILDLDLDIFSDDMSYIDKDLKFQYIRDAVNRASFITVATSPYFINQLRAIEYLAQLFKDH